jgi:GT2 family glycosyltransferase
MKVSVVIPNWNGEDKLRRNLPEVFKISGVSEIIVVDDKSTDDSVYLLETKFKQVKLIKKEKNEGFSSTVNLGVKNATGELVFLLNTDAVPAKDSLTFILPHFKHNKVFSVGLNAGGNWSWASFEKGYFWHYEAQKSEKQMTHETLWVSGGSGVFRKSIWEKLEGLDTLFDPFYEEDVDLGYRASKRGYVNLWEPKAKVDHYKEKGVIEENFSKKAVAKIAQRNQLFFIWKNITDEKLYNSHKMALAKKLITNPKYWSIFLSANKHRSEILKKRQIEKRESVVSDQEMLGKYP